jgi:endoglucanase
MFAAATALVVSATAVTAGSANASAAVVAGLVHVDQVGYLPGDVKQAFLMASQVVHGAHFTVVNAASHVVYSGTVDATSRGRWNAAYPDVYPMTFSSVRPRGRTTSW